MPAPGSTPIIIYNSATASATPSAGNLTQGELAINVTDKKIYTKDSGGNVITVVGTLGNQAANNVAITGGSITGVTGVGDVVGPASATDNAIARFDGTTGKLVQNSAVTIADTTGDITGGKYNKVTITAPATGSTLTIADGKTATINNTMTLSGTDSTTLTMPSATTTLVGVGTNQTFTKAQRGSITALSDGANIATDMSLNNFFSVTLGGNRTLDNPTNIVAGQSGCIFITQDATGSRTLAYGSYWDFAGGTAPTLTTTANAVDRLDYVVRTATSIHAVLTKAYS